MINMYDNEKIKRNRTFWSNCFYKLSENKLFFVSNTSKLIRWCNIIYKMEWYYKKLLSVNIIDSLTICRKSFKLNI